MIARKKYKLIIIVCLVVVVIALITVHKPSVSQYKEDFGFSLDNINITTLDYYHHDDFRDSLTIYRVRISGEEDKSIFDSDKMSEGLSSDAEIMLNMAVDQTKDKENFSDLSSIDTVKCKSIVLDNVKKKTDERLCVISYSSNEYFVIWVG